MRTFQVPAAMMETAKEDLRLCAMLVAPFTLVLRPHAFLKKNAGDDHHGLAGVPGMACLWRQRDYSVKAFDATRGYPGEGPGNPVGVRRKFAGAFAMMLRRQRAVREIKEMITDTREKMRKVELKKTRMLRHARTLEEELIRHRMRRARIMRLDAAHPSPESAAWREAIKQRWLAAVQTACERKWMQLLTARADLRDELPACNEKLMELRALHRGLIKDEEEAEDGVQVARYRAAIAMIKGQSADRGTAATCAWSTAPCGSLIRRFVHAHSSGSSGV